MKFTKWMLPSSHDIIFGKPWFAKYQPVINWRTNEVRIPQDDKYKTSSPPELFGQTLQYT